VATELGIPPEQLRAAIAESRARLYTARAQRAAPPRDEKILAAWNGLMISAYARAVLAFGDGEDANRAARAADFVLSRMRKDGRLLRSYKDGRAQHDAYLEDYACMIAALLDLYEATGDLRWLDAAISLDGVLALHYEDQTAGGFFMTSDDHEKLLAREKPDYDGAEPSGNSIQTLNLLRLHELTTDDRYRQRAERALRSQAAILKRAPAALSEALLAVDYDTDTPKEIVIVTPHDRGEAAPFLARLEAAFVPNRTLTVTAESTVAQQATRVPLVEGKIARGGKPTAYVCENRVCALPTADPATFAQQIGRVRPLESAPQKTPAPPRDPSQ